jgi:SAM-dependent methyltransferase
MKLDLNQLRPINFNSKIFKQNKIIAKNVSNGSGNKKVEKCPICKSSKRRPYQTKYDIPIYICLKCDVGYAGLQPKNLNEVYSNKHYLSKLTINENRKYRMKRFGKERVGILRRYKKKGSILDFGCGSGYFIETARKYFNAEGIEFSDNLRYWLKKKLNLVTFKTLSETRKKYDVITAFDVIEHVENPTNLLKEFKKKLKKDGIILIYTPNRDSLGFNFLGYNNNLLVPPAHLFYFNKSSFDIMAKKAGLKIAETQFRGLDVGDIFAFLRENKKTKIANFLKKNSDIIQNKIDQLEFSNAVRFILKKI